MERPAPTGEHPAHPDDLRPGADVRAHRGAGQDDELRRPDEPGEAALRVPLAPEPEGGRMEPGEVLGVAHQAGRPEHAVRAGLVEPDAIGGLVERRPVRGPAGAVVIVRPPRPIAGQVLERLDRDEPGRRVRRRLPVEPDLARAAGVEDDERHGQVDVLVGRVRPRVVELVQDVRADPARAPLAVDRLRRRPASRR